MYENDDGTRPTPGASGVNMESLQGCHHGKQFLVKTVSIVSLLNRVGNALKVAGEEGFEPSLTDPESAVLPLDDSPEHLKL